MWAFINYNFQVLLAVREAIIPSVEVTRRRMRINDVKNIQKERPLYIETHSWYLSSLSAALIP